MAYVNLPGVFPEKIDGGLAILASSAAPRILVLGTSDKGLAETPYVVGRAQEAAVTFGTTGTLIRGMYEVKTAGGENVILFRMGATAATLVGIGVDAATGGVAIETATKDDSAGTDYSFYWDNTSTAQRLVVKNVASGTIVFDRSFDEVEADIDRGEVFVSGSPTDGEGEDIGDPSTFITLAAAGQSTSPDYDVTYTAGTDGTSPSRMELWEFLYKSYKLLENEDFDEVVPMDAYLDDLNVMDLTAAEITTLGLVSLAAYPTAGAEDDALGKVFVEEYQGEYYMFWWFPADPENPSFAAANIYPSVGSASSTLKIDGTALAESDFREVNFAYQLADFCWTVSNNNTECIGMVGVKPPTSVALKDVSQWIGTAPTYTTATDGSQSITGTNYNGTGLLGNKFMAGKYGFRSNVAYGGFIGTDTHFLDGTEEEDRGGHKIDIGAYISVVAAWPTLFNSYDTTGFGYISSGAPTYAGMVSDLAPKSAPTNKVVEGVSLPFRINNTKLDALAGMRYVLFQDKAKGTVVADAPVAARPDSDYQRLTTVRIVKEVIDAIRLASDPFIGEAGGAAQRAALQTACENALSTLQKGGSIQRYDMAVTATPAQRVVGDATIELTLVPAWELRQITLVISLAAL
jgi:hypothetical protein